MPRFSAVFLVLLFGLSPLANAQETHSHGAPARLGRVSFPISCQPAVQAEFDRGVALLHSFAYAPAESAFRRVAETDPRCAMAHWGIAMTHFHELWDPPLAPGSVQVGWREIQAAQKIDGFSKRERGYIEALSCIYQDAESQPYPVRVRNYMQAMGIVAAENVTDPEAQIFYALALLAAASPADKTHANQKHAADLLEPLFRAYPEHPGIPHYLIHAYDNAELAPKGLTAARAYSRIAPSAPHALHMPSHIFTRLGLWDDSIASNLAARAAANKQSDTGEELHAMDYLVYAYLQKGSDTEAAAVIEQLRAMPNLNTADPKIAYAATAMPVRYAIERRQWNDASAITPLAGAPPHIAAIAIWARGFGLARTGHPAEAEAQAKQLQEIAAQLRKSGNDYWATQTEILFGEVMAWSALARGDAAQSERRLREAADQEDAVEKLPVTPGPIVPAREQLGDLLLEQGRPAEASKEFAAALANAPGRRGALRGAAQAGKLAAQK
ncbi:MAG TPA: hypothetical protein VMH00_17200 [Candidatus Limnocylindrales bacterium]|nr:hypothetical protein [Candidatus Limnocylindrales bacterium]